MSEKIKTENYYTKKITKVEDLKHFPFSSFQTFKEALKDGTVVDIPIAMDMARSWLTNAENSPIFWRSFSTFLMFVPYLVMIFYLVATFWLSNFWLLLFIPLSIIVTFTGSPAARRLLPIHYILIVAFVLMWVIGGKFPDLVYWLPILIIFLSLNQLYSGSAKVAREAVIHDEKTLCLFWKWHWMDIVLKSGDTYSQRSTQTLGQTFYHEDIDKEWKEYCEQREAERAKSSIGKK